MQLAVSLANNQLANGDMYLIEQPWQSEARNETVLRDFEHSEDSCVAICDMCAIWDWFIHNFTNP